MTGATKMIVATLDQPFCTEVVCEPPNPSTANSNPSYTDLPLPSSRYISRVSQEARRQHRQLSVWANDAAL